MSWLSGGVLFVVGALVWGAYLLPTLIRRRQQHASGLEAEQFEHALVALAETGELPEQPLSAREHIRLARAQDRAERKIERENLRALSSAERERKQSERTARLEEKRSVAHRRAELIRLRTFTAWTLLVAVLCAVGGVVAVFFGVTWIVSGVGLVVAIGAVFALRVIARALTSLRQTAVAQAPVSVSFRDVPLGQQAATIPSRTWQPTALPAPLHLAPGSAAASTIASSEALEALRRRAREIAAEAVEPTPPSLVAARARAAAMAAHPSSYGQRMRARMAAEAQVRGSASANVPMAVPRTAAEQAAARILAAGDIAATASAQLDVADVLQRRRVG